MDEYIKRKDALEITKRTSGDYATAFAEICKIPAANISPVVYGRWEQDADGDWYCTNCKQWQTFDKFGDLHPKDDYDYYYCPMCGAKMDGEDEPK